MSVRMPDGRCTSPSSKLPLSVRLGSCLAMSWATAGTGAFYTYRAQAAGITSCELRAERWGDLLLAPV